MNFFLYVTNSKGISFEVPFSAIEGFYPLKNNHLLVYTSEFGVLTTRVRVEDYLEVIERLGTAS